MNTPPTEKELKQIEKRLFSACNKYGYPYFFVHDFIEYQHCNNWLYNGKPLKGVTYCFRGYAKVRKQNLINRNKWYGSKDESWDLTLSVFLGYYKANKQENKIYMDKLALKLNKGEILTDTEKMHAEKAGIVKVINWLKKHEPNNENKKPLRIVCEQCGRILFSYQTEKEIFCKTCCKHTLFVKMNED